jgi:hypothetical protein
MTGELGWGWNGRERLRAAPAHTPTHAEYLAIHLQDATLRWFEDAAVGHASMDWLHMVIDDPLAA